MRLRDMGPLPAARAALRRRLEHRRRVEFYRQFAGRGTLCFDVGAHIGDRTQLFLDIPARVVAVEPQRVCQAALAAKYGARDDFTLVRAALGAEPGEAAILVADDGDASVLATLSEEWIERVRSSGRFARFHWDRTEHVEVTTLDALIERHGLPAFCKVDVEGYEPAVLAGLSTAIPALSFEFTPERFDATEACTRRLEELGAYEFNYSLNESLVLAAERWLTAPELLETLAGYRADTVVFGDAYARLRGGLG
jgi:FkbM family methyltransferase